MQLFLFLPLPRVPFPPRLHLNMCLRSFFFHLPSLPTFIASYLCHPPSFIIHIFILLTLFFFFGSFPSLPPSSPFRMLAFPFSSSSSCFCYWFRPAFFILSFLIEYSTLFASSFASLCSDYAFSFFLFPFFLFTVIPHLCLFMCVH